MNKRSMKKGLPVRLLALLLCCFCLLSAIPTQALATDDVTPPVQEEVTPEPKTDEPQTEEPQTEEPKTGEPQTEEPKTGEPQTEEPQTDEPQTDDPQTEEPKTNEPQTEDPQVEEPTLSLYDRLLACTSMEQINDILNGELTAEEEAEMDDFTQEQQDALQQKIAELGGYDFNTLDTQYITHSYTIQAGNTTNVDVTVDSGSLTYSCSESGITATRNSSGGYTISVAGSVKASTYTLTVNYSSTDGFFIWTTTTDYVDTVTITVPEVSSSEKNVKLNVVLDHTVATYAYYENETWHWGETYTHGQTFSVYYKGKTDSIEYFVFFAKPEENYLLTTFTIKNVLSSTTGQQTFDLYSVENYTNSAIKSYPKLAELCAVASRYGYVTMNGYRTTANGSDTNKTEFTHYFNAVKPTLAVTATPDTDEVKPGDTVNFTVTVTPEVNLSEKQDATVESITVTSLEINGKVYKDVTLTAKGDGTYTTNVAYVATASDWTVGQIALTVDANVKYSYKIVVYDRDKKESSITSESTVASSGTATVTLANDYGVGYELRFNPEKITPPATIPVAPIDANRYYAGQDVTVLSYDRTAVDDPANGGTWTFSGWAYADKTDYTKGDTIKMPQNGILLVGIWTFKPYPTQTLTVEKKITGNAYNSDKTFLFTITANRTMTYGDDTRTSFSFTLGKDDTATFTVPVGATVTVTEDPGTYTPSYSGVTGEPVNTDDPRAYGTTFTMPDKDCTVTFTNDKTVKIETAVDLDFAPYVLLLTVTAFGALLLLRKRRSV